MLDNKKICRLLNSKKLTRYRISKETGIAQSYINSLMNGSQKNPSLEVAYKLARLLEVTIDDLIKK